jgi:hypothetical protein
MKLQVVINSKVASERGGPSAITKLQVHDSRLTLAGAMRRIVLFPGWESSRFKFFGVEIKEIWYVHSKAKVVV